MVESIGISALLGRALGEPRGDRSGCATIGAKQWYHDRSEASVTIVRVNAGCVK